MSQRKHRKTISLLLIFCLLLSCLPGGAIAQTTEAEPQASAAPTTAVTPADTFQLDADCQILRYVDESVFTAGNHVARLTEQETLDTYVFLNADGTQTVYYMDENVKFLDENGVAREKDITLTASTAGFTTARNNVGLSLPTNLAQGITISYGGYDVNLIPENIAAATAVQQDGKIAYLNCYGKGTELIYTPTLSGVKEDILLGMYTGVNSFSFLLNTDGLRLYTNEQGRYYFAKSANAEFKVELADIVAYDANGRHSLGSIAVTPITMGQQYRLTVTVDEEFLTAETTAYPVLIDPTITVSDTLTGANAIEDATIYQGQPNLNTGTWQFNHAGYYDSTYGLGKTVVRLSGLLSNSIYQSVSADQIQSATFHLREATGTAPETVKLIALNGSSTWTETSVTWNDIDTTNSRLQGSKDMSYNQPCAFYITTTVRLWKDGYFSSGQCGILLELEDNTAGAKAFVASEYSVADMRPYVVVHYSLEDESVNVDEGDTVTLSTTGISGTITWESENEAIATVNNGVVTGVKAGQVNITASVDGILQKTFVVYVTIPDGTYSLSPTQFFFLTADKISYSDNTPLKLTVMHTTQAQSPTDNHSDVPDRLSQIWYIRYIQNGYYTISTIYKDSLKLKATSQTSVALCESASMHIYWKIAVSASPYTYTISNVGYSNCYLGWTGGALSNVEITSDSTSTYASWYINPIAAEGLLLLDSQTGERVDTDTETLFSFERMTTSNVVVPLSTLGIEAKVFDSTNPSTALVWTTSDANIADVNLTTGALTIKAFGNVTISAIRTINGKLHSLSYQLYIVPTTISVSILYDGAYALKYSDPVGKMANLTQQLRRQYLIQFGVDIEFSTPQRYVSLADSCPNLDSYDRCGCGNSSANSTCEYPHSDFVANANNTPRPTSGKRIAFIGHDMCFESDSNHYFNSNGLLTILGLAEQNGALSCIATSTTPTITDADELKVVVHEFGHLFNAPDHYLEGQTAALNSYVTDGNFFHDDCIYGVNKSVPYIVSTLTMCAGCKARIGEALTLP